MTEVPALYNPLVLNFPLTRNGKHIMTLKCLSGMVNWELFVPTHINAFGYMTIIHAYIACKSSAGFGCASPPRKISYILVGRITHAIDPMSMALASLLVLFLLALAEGVGQSTADHVDQTETHRGTAHDSARAELLPEGLAAAARQQEVQAGKRGAHSSRVRLEALKTGVAGEEEGGGEEHGKWAERARILREDEGRQNDRGKGVL